MRPKHFVWIIMLALLSSRAFAADDEPTNIDIALKIDTSEMIASFNITSSFTENFRKKLGGGLTSQVEVRVDVVDRELNIAASATRDCKLRLDVWDDLIFVEIDENERVRRQQFSLIDDALRACGVVDRILLGDPSLLRRGDDYRVLVSVFLNPVSPELLERTREFTTNPRGTQTRPRSFLGAVARLFRNESSAAGEVFMFQSKNKARPLPGEAR